MTDEKIEWLKRHGRYAVRKASADEDEVWGDGWVVCDTETGEVIGADGGAPEDQLLVRDWDWVPWALNEAFEAGRRAQLSEHDAQIHLHFKYEAFLRSCTPGGEKTRILLQDFVDSLETVTLGEGEEP